VSEEEVAPLPDFALTAYAAGFDALRALLVAKLVPLGDYECPRCAGTGRDPAPWGREALACGACLGVGIVEVTLDGFVLPTKEEG
jgi:hypothetical protein